MKNPATIHTALRFTLLICLSAALTAHGLAVPPKAVPKQTLAAALAQAEPPKDSVALAVAADKAELPEKTVPTAAEASLATVADTYGLVVTPLDTVTALAPPTMTVVYSPPDTPNPYEGMPPGKVMKLLTANFQAAQWKAFLSDEGIGYSDLSGDTQQQLFAALFPGGKLAVIEDNPAGANDPKTKQEFSGETLKLARLHLGYMVSLALPDTGKPDEHVFAGGPEAPGTPKRYFMTNALDWNVDHEFGAKVREVVPTAAKPGDLAFDSEALKASVTVDGLKTVDDLVARIGTAAHLELYADPRYGTRTVTLVGKPMTAHAGDLLKALALCVSGTYRKVGPAYVLTDDVVGLGTRHALWKRFEEKAAALLPGGGAVYLSAAPTPEMPYTMQDISWGRDPLAFTPAQRRKFWGDWAKQGGMSGISVLDVTLPYAQLSPAQQEEAELLQRDNEKNHTDTTLDGTVMVQAEPMLEITLPALDGPVMVFQSYESLLPYPRLTPAEDKAQQRPVATVLPPMFGIAPPPTPLRPVVQTFMHRAVRIAPQTPAEVTRAVASLAALGFNELWVQMTPALKPGSDTEALSLLAQAVTEGRAVGIAVFPDLHLLRWDPSTPPGLLDRVLTGETALQASAAAQYPDGDAHDTVTPFAPEVEARLMSLVSRVGAVPGLGGLVWEDYVPTGYEAFTPDGGDMSGGFGMPLGYAEAGRLAALRRFHADPVDLYTNYYSDSRADVHVPGLDDFNTERGLYNQWRTLRTQTREALTRHLAEALPPAFRGPARLPLLVPPANSTFSQRYGSWDDLRGSPPEVTYVTQRGPDGLVLIGGNSVEQMASQRTYLRLDVYGNPDASDKLWAQSAAQSLRQAVQSPDRNIVLDVTRKPSLLDSLAETERSLSAPKQKSP